MPVVTLEELTAIRGKVKQIGVDRVGSDDNLNITFRPEGESENREFTTNLADGTTAILAQLQLLRDALEKDFDVRIYYLDDGSDPPRFYAVRIW